MVGASAYDSAGNRTSMTDGPGRVDYEYNQLSQLTSETRHFGGLVGPNAGGFALAYTYHRGGQLASVTNPWGFDVNYHRDHTGLVRHVGGASYHGVTTYATNIEYRASGAVKALVYGNSRQLQMQYDNRMRLTRWEVPGLNALEYHYNNFYENGGRVTYARNLYDGTLDRSYQYDHVGRLVYAYSGGDARKHVAGVGVLDSYDGPYAHAYQYDRWGNITARAGWGGWNAEYTYQHADNRVTWMQYDASGHVTYEGGRFAYDATGQQTWAGDYPPEWGGYTLAQMYDGDRLRAKKVERGVATYYVRSSVLGGQVIAELHGDGGWARGFVYDGGGGLLAIQQAGVRWVHQDPVTKSQRLTDAGGGWAGSTELDPWGGGTNRGGGETWRQPRTFGTYERDGNGRDQAMHRSYHGWFSRYDQPDPYDGSYDLTDPQSFNRYAYVQNDPVNFVDPTGLEVDWPFGLGPPPPLPGILNESVTVVASAGWSWGWGFGGSISRSLPLPDLPSPVEGIGGGGEPQEPAPSPTPTRFENCANQAGVGGTGFNEDAANLVLRISAAEGTAPNLLAYTWGRESSFSMNPVPNTNGTTNTGRWDFGPFQLNAYRIGRAIQSGQVNADGIDIGGALGGHGVRAGQPFAGDPYDNGRLAARFLNSLGTGRDAAGRFTGGTRVADRAKGFDTWGPRLQAFFDCFRR